MAPRSGLLAFGCLLLAASAGWSVTPRELESALGVGASEEPVAPAPLTARQVADNELWFRERGGDAPTALPAAPGGTVRVTGRVQWTDSAGGVHPAPFVRVEIRDDELITSDLVSTVLTDAGGNYTSLVDNDDGEGQAGRDIFIRAIANSGGTNVDAGFTSGPYYVDSSPNADVADGSELQIDLTANNTDNNNIAFGILNALVEAELFIRSLTGSFPTPTVVHFPSSTGTFYQPTFDYISLTQARAFDWDSVLHEYGHRVGTLAGIDVSAGADHSSGDNLAERQGKAAGLNGAWSEGFATFFSIWAQVSRGTAALNIPWVGDDVYTQTEMGVHPVSLDIEGQELGCCAQGEDNETSVARILYDVYDAGGGEPNDRLALGTSGLWNLLQTNHPQTLFALWNALVAGASVEDEEKVGAIFTMQSVAPLPSAPEKNATLTPDAIFRWRPNGAGPSYRLNHFVLYFYSPDLATLKYNSPEITTPLSIDAVAGPQWGWDPSAADRQALAEAGPLVWVVAGTNTASPQTGPYLSAARPLGGIKLSYVIDTTGSMSEENDAIRGALNRFIDVLASEPNGITVQLVTFKDAPQVDFAGSDLAGLRSAVEGLGADGGGDCPEGSAQGLSMAARAMLPGGVIFLDTDADPLPGSDVPATIAELRGKGLRVNVLLSGSCTEDVESAAAVAGNPCRAQQCKSIKRVDVVPPVPLAPPEGDDHANAALGATPVAVGGAPAFGSIDPAGDVDYLSFDATAGTTYAIATRLGTLPDSVLTLYAPDGTTQVDFNDDGGGDRSSRIVFTPTADGTYFAAVGGYGGSTGTFDLTVGGAGDGGLAAGAIQTFSQIANETGGVFAFIPGVNDDSDEARRYESAALDIMSGAVKPTVPAVEPARAPQGASLVVTVRGLKTNFSAASTVAFAGGGVSAGTPIVLSPTELQVPVAVDAGAPLGFGDVTVRTPLGAGNETAVGHDAFKVVAPPSGAVVTGIVPSVLELGTTSEVRVFGFGTTFDASSLLSLGVGIAVDAATAVSATELRARVTVAGDAALGFHDVAVTTGAQVATESGPGPLLVVRRLASSIPRLVSVTPARGKPGDSLTVVVTGANTQFVAGDSTAAFLGGGVSVVATRVVDATTAQVDVVIAAAATLGFRDVTVTTKDEVAAGLNLFEVSSSADLCPGLAGFDAALCALNASLAVPACDGQSPPRSIKKKFTAARNLAKRAAAAKKPKKQQKLLAGTARALAAALKGVGKGETRAKKPLTADCVTALEAVITGAESRVQAVTQAPQ